jgi:hypothetical protein
MLFDFMEQVLQVQGQLHHIISKNTHNTPIQVAISH